MDTWCWRIEASRNLGAGYVRELEYHPNDCNPFPSHKNPSYASPDVGHRKISTSHSNTPGSALAPSNAPPPSCHSMNDPNGQPHDSPQTHQDWKAILF